MNIQSLLPLLLALWTGAAAAPEVGAAAGSPADVADPGDHDPSGDVEEVRIAPEGTRTEITIFTRGDVEARDFLLQDPARLIVDLEGARHSLSGHSFEGIARGGVIRLRSSQFRQDVVRLVFDLSAPVDYAVEEEGDRIRVRFSNPGGAFAAWSTSSPGQESARTVARAKGRSAATSGARGDRDGSAAARADRRAATGAARPAGGTADARPEALQQSRQPEISVRYDSASVLDVIAGFSDFSGVSIVPGEGVQDKVVRGVDIQDQPWDVALDAILESQGLGWRRTESGIILVDDLQSIRARDTLQTETRVFRVNYAGADSVAQTLQQIASPKGQVVSYQSTNSVIVTDAPSVVSRMDSLITVLDRRTPQVAIEAKIVFVDRTNINELGITYDLRDNSGLRVGQETPSSPQGGAEDGDGDGGDGGTDGPTTVDFDGSSIAAVGNANSDLRNQSALSILAATAFGDFSLFAFLDAVEEHQLSDVQAAPSTQVLDNQTARIQVGERTPIRVLEPSAQVDQAQVNVQFEDTGIILEVTPHVTNNNQILLDLMAERSAVNTAVAADLGFIFDKQTAESRLLLNDGETAVIAGLTSSELTRRRRGIPGLMNIPLLGNLFRTTSEEETKEDLIILVTPHIVNPRGQPGTGTAPGMPSPSS
jgi:type IV pilus assembly protein PilQ